MSILSATLSGLQYDASEAFLSPVKCDGCAGWWEFEECRVEGDLLFCPGCASEPPPPPPVSEHDAAPTCGCGADLRSAGELACGPCRTAFYRADSESRNFSDGRGACYAD